MKNATLRNAAFITGFYGGLGSCFQDIHASKGGGLILVGRSQKKLASFGINAEEALRAAGVPEDTFSRRRRA